MVIDESIAGKATVLVAEGRYSLLVVAVLLSTDIYFDPARDKL